MAIVQPFFSTWRMRVLLETLTVSSETNTHQTIFRYKHANKRVLSRLMFYRTSLVLATYMPALLGHLIFALDQSWFWKHMIIQCVMGTASTFLPAYTLATLHEVSIDTQAPAFQRGSTAHAGHRLVGGREEFEVDSLALPLELPLVWTKCNLAQYIYLPHAGGFTLDVSPYVPQPFPTLIKSRVLLHSQLVQYLLCLLPIEAMASFCSKDGCQSIKGLLLLPRLIVKTQ